MRGARLRMAALTVLAAYVAICALVYLGRNWFVFPIRGGPAARGERVDLAGLAAWFYPGEKGALLWFHGNGETVAGLEAVLREFRVPGVAMLAMDYRGSVEEAKRDAESALDWLRSRGFERIVVYGRSVGTGPAIHLAASRQVDGLILESGFTSLRALARRHYPILPSFLAPGGFENVARVSSIECPVLFIHGEADRLIPISMGRALEARTKNRAGFMVIPGADHNDTYDMGGEEYPRRVREFVTRLTAS